MMMFWFGFWLQIMIVGVLFGVHGEGFIAARLR